MREPDFWHDPQSLTARLLAPLGSIYGAISGARMKQRGARGAVPVICVGNYHTGGAGKTPTVLAVCAILEAIGEKPFVVSRGYGGSERGPVLVDPKRHSFSQVGDEPLMMAALRPVVVSKDRVAGAALANAQGASVVVLDDSFQNPSLQKDLSLIVIDAARGVGNGFVFPAGPLRAPLGVQIARTDALIVIGKGEAASIVANRVQGEGGVFLKAELVPDAALTKLRGKKVLAFAGIGDPSRFVRTLRDGGVVVEAQRTFADHHAYTSKELSALRDEARQSDLILVTTEKDIARIRSDASLAMFADLIEVLPVKLEFESLEPLETLLRERIAKARL